LQEYEFDEFFVFKIFFFSFPKIKRQPDKKISIKKKIFCLNLKRQNQIMDKDQSQEWLPPQQKIKNFIK